MWNQGMAGFIFFLKIQIIRISCWGISCRWNRLNTQVERGYLKNKNHKVKGIVIWQGIGSSLCHEEGKKTKVVQVDGVLVKEDEISLEKNEGQSV